MRGGRSTYIHSNGYACCLDELVVATQTVAPDFAQRPDNQVGLQNSGYKSVCLSESALQILFDSVYYFITRLLLDMSTPEYDDLIEVRLQNRLIWRGLDD